MASFRESVRNAGVTAVAEKFSRILSIDELEEDPEIMRVFIIDEGLLEEISGKMREEGFDRAFPPVVWKRGEKWTIVDGHTRYRAALRAGLKEIPVCEKEFESKEDALLYTYRCQRLRRNLTQAEILNVAALLNNKRGRSAEERIVTAEIAKDMGMSRSYMQRTRKVLQEAPEEVLAALQKNTPGVTITGVYNKIKKAKAERRKEAALPSPEPAPQAGGETKDCSSKPVENTACKNNVVDTAGDNKAINIRLCMIVRHLVQVLKSSDVVDGGAARLAVQKALRIALGLYMNGKRADSFVSDGIIGIARELVKDVEDVNSVEWAVEA